MAETQVPSPPAPDIRCATYPVAGGPTAPHAAAGTHVDPRPVTDAPAQNPAEQQEPHVRDAAAQEPRTATSRTLEPLRQDAKSPGSAEQRMADRPLRDAETALPRRRRSRESRAESPLHLGGGSSPLALALGFAALCAIWGEFPVATKVGITNQPPMLVVGMRFTLAGLLLGAIIRARGGRVWLERGDIPIVTFISMTIVGIPATAFFLGAQYAQVSVLTLVWSVQPIFLSLLNIGNESEGQSPLTAAGMVAGFAGVTLVILGGSGVRMSGAALAAELAVAASALLYSLGFQQVRRSVATGDLLVLTAWQLFLAGVLNFVLSLIFEHRMPSQPTPETLSAFAFLVIFCSCVAYGLTNWLVRHMGTVRTGYNALLTPVITVLLAAPQLGEPITAKKLLGLALVVFGMLLVMPRTRRSRNQMAWMRADDTMT